MGDDGTGDGLVTSAPIDKLTYIPLEEAVTPKNGLTAMTDRWWVAHPEMGLAVWNRGSLRSPQCNSERLIVDDIIEKMYPGHEAVFMPLVFWKESDAWTC